MQRRLQKSRLNSLADLNMYCYNKYKKGSKELKHCLRLNEASNELDSSEEYNENERETKKHYNTHPYWQIQEYIEFKAARTIQRIVRGWLVRTNVANQTWAAIVIQREWRRFYYQRWFYNMVETLLQKRIKEHFYRSAQIIQSLYRGWWTRQHVHDHTRLVRLELNAGEDLLHCVAFKLHHLLRTYHIPGIYSLRNSTALSKVEQLLASMTFKQCNDRAQAAQRRKQIQIEEAKKTFKNSAYGTELPYSGPDIYNLCEPKCIALYSEVDADRKMMKILNMYEMATREDPCLTKMRKKRVKAHRHFCMPPPTSFCGDVVRSMKKWKIVQESKYKVEPNILRNPENVENFLKEVHSKWSILHGQCHCHQEYVLDAAKQDIERIEKINEFSGIH